MQIILNNNLYNTQDKITLNELVKELKCKRDNIAVAVNLSVIPQSDYNDFVLNENDKVEIVTAFQGG
ncbi:MAG TPA: sulfur carrier protein ThiS [Burkholderiales bacterium]|nr:sulfur carrier protein ThiS [Burkholderiales bacterium]